jgi:hypothetical protein
MAIFIAAGVDANDRAVLAYGYLTRMVLISRQQK